MKGVQFIKDIHVFSKIKQLKQVDEIFIKSIDRLGRNYDEIITQWKIITKDKAVHIVVIDFLLKPNG